MGDQQQLVASFFSSFAPQWDTLYGGKRNVLWRAFDATFRRDIYKRYTFTFEVMGRELAGKSVLDVGCGSGVYCIEAARRGARVLGADAAAPMIAIATRAADLAGVHCRFAVAQLPRDAAHLEISGPFDFVLMLGLLEYVEDPVLFLRMLRPLAKGQVIASVPGRQPIRYLLRRARYRWLGRPDVFHYNAEQVRSIFEQAGFALKRAVYWPHSGGCHMVVAE